jgi:hypothetical protein
MHRPRRRANDASNRVSRIPPRILYVVIGALVAGGIAFPAPANADEPFMSAPMDIPVWPRGTQAVHSRTTCALLTRASSGRFTTSTVRSPTRLTKCSDKPGSPQISSVVRKWTRCAALVATTRSFFCGDSLIWRARTPAPRRPRLSREHGGESSGRQADDLLGEHETN